ncbi:MAG: FMN-binding protein [Nitrospira sp.]
MEESQKNNYAVIVGVALLALAVVGYGVYKYTNKSNSVPSEVPTLPIVDNTPPVATTTASRYKNGVYSSVGNYAAPSGPESINVQVTLTDDVITDSQVIANAKGDSAKFQKKFISGYKTLVTGKKIDDVMLDKVSGSSLTPKGFNDAIEKIKATARA